MRARKLGTIVLIAVCAAGGLWLFAAVLFPLLLPLFIGLAVAAMGAAAGSRIGAQDEASPGARRFFVRAGDLRAGGDGAFSFVPAFVPGGRRVLHQLPELAGRLEGPAKALQDRLYAIADKFPTAWAPAFARDLRAF